LQHLIIVKQVGKYNTKVCHHQDNICSSLNPNL